MTTLTSSIQFWLRTLPPGMTVSELIEHLDGAAVVAKPKVKKTKAKKDPNAPKKAASAYLFFCKEARVELKAAGITGKEVMVKMGEMWRNLVDKTAYTAKSDADKVRYATEMETYVPAE